MLSPIFGSTVLCLFSYPETGEKRTVIVPPHLSSHRTLQHIVDQCEANDFRAWCRWIDEHR